MSENQQPIFLFSLPRSGSTLLQRILGSHEDIATVSEPWLLLPLFYTRRKGGVYAEYDHNAVVTAIDDFIGNLPAGSDDYHAAIRDFAKLLYCKASPNGERYFLDKTPRYHLIADQIVSTFGGEAKYIFLWRHPLAVVASIIETWLEGRWKLHLFKVDLYKGLIGLVDTLSQHQDCAYSMRYEDLVQQPHVEIDRILACLDLPYDPALLDQLPQIELTGRLGDQWGNAKYSQISSTSLEKWKGSFTNSYRKNWGRRYLEWIGRERLALMGYDVDHLVEELESIPVAKGSANRDIIDTALGHVHGLIEPTIYKQKIRVLPNWRHIVAHR